MEGGGALIASYCNAAQFEYQKNPMDLMICLKLLILKEGFTYITWPGDSGFVILVTQAHEEKLLESLIDTFKKKCMREVSGRGGGWGFF